MGYGSLVESNFNITGTKMLSERGTRMTFPGHRNVAPYHIPGDI